MAAVEELVVRDPIFSLVLGAVTRTTHRWLVGLHAWRAMGGGITLASARVLAELSATKGTSRSSHSSRVSAAPLGLLLFTLGITEAI